MVLSIQYRDASSQRSDRQLILIHRLRTGPAFILYCSRIDAAGMVRTIFPTSLSCTIC